MIQMIQTISWNKGLMSIILKDITITFTWITWLNLSSGTWWMIDTRRQLLLRRVKQDWCNVMIRWWGKNWEMKMSDECFGWKHTWERVYRSFFYSLNCSHMMKIIVVLHWWLWLRPWGNLFELYISNHESFSTTIMIIHNHIRQWKKVCNPYVNTL